MKKPKTTKTQRKSQKQLDLERITTQTYDVHVSMSSYEISCRLGSIYEERTETEESILDLTKKLAMLKDRLAAENATVEGLVKILDSRKESTNSWTMVHNFRIPK